MIDKGRIGRAHVGTVSIAVLALLTVGGAARADFNAEVARMDARIEKEMEAAGPRALEKWHEASATLEGGDLEKGAALLREVHELVPGSSHPLRRLCRIAWRQGKRDEAVRLCRQAVALAPTPANRSSLAGALSMPLSDTRPASVTDLDEAMALAEQAASDRSSEGLDQIGLCDLAMRRNSLPTLRRCVGLLSLSAPDEAETHFFAAILAADDAEWDRSLAELARARALGLPAERADPLEANIRDAIPLWTRALPYGLRIGGIWVALMLFLIVAGFSLSAAALRASRQVPSVATGNASGLSGLVRSLYRGLLWICCVYYYVSIPVVLALVVGFGGAMVYGMMMAGRVPLQLLAIVGVVVVTTFIAVGRSLFLRRVDEAPGARLDLSPEPAVRAVLDEVAARVGTRPVDNVYLTPGTDLAVTERGDTLWRQLRGARSERCLILGAGVLDGMSRASLKSILAHEYGHFQNRDTAGGGFALAVRRSLLAFALHLARGGAARWYNPAWLFVSGFYKVFMRISQGASRLQEVLCDRWAAFAYGSEAFELGLSHVVAQEVRFHANADQALREVVDGKKVLPNLYRYAVEKPPEEEELTRALNQKVHEKPSPYASHPSPAERIALVQSLAAKGAAFTDEDRAPAWSLFADREAIEKLMTRVVIDRIAERGVRIPTSEEEKKAAEERDEEPGEASE